MECGECTLCCKLLETHSPYSHSGDLCYLCTKSGCSIYEARSKECREYQCMWSQMEKVSLELRPDLVHVIFEKISDKTIFGLHDSEYEFSELLNGQIQSFNNQGFTVLLVSGNTKSIYRVKGHSKEEAIAEAQFHVAKIMERIKNDSSQLY